MTIVDFLLARVAEDEAAARRASAVTAPEWVANGSVLMHIADPATRLAEPTATVEHYKMDDAWRHTERHDPARVLAECAAKRAIIEEHQHEVGYVVAYRESDRLIAEGYDLDTVPLQGSAAMIPTCLRHLAAVHADHPDYREEWRP